MSEASGLRLGGYKPKRSIEECVSIRPTQSLHSILYSTLRDYTKIYYYSMCPESLARIPRMKSAQNRARILRMKTRRSKGFTYLDRYSYDSRRHEGLKSQIDNTGHR